MLVENFKIIWRKKLPENFKIIWVNKTWLEGDYIKGGFQKYPNKSDLIRRSRC